MPYMFLGSLHDPPWDPTSVSEPLDETVPPPLGYSNDLGEMDLLDLNIDLSDLGEVTDVGVEIKQSM